jgi:murein DD-endopeptidase MepM/ murein hydrolase activator NlpD
MMSWKTLSLLSVSLLALSSCEDRSHLLPVNSSIPVYTYGAGVGGGSLGMYTVGQGETVWQISQRYNLALRDVLDANELSAPYDLHKGQRLNLPAPQTYKVKPNDTLYLISQLFNTSTSDIARLNKLTPPYKLNAGQTLRLPPRYKPAPVISQQAALRAPERPPAQRPSQPASGRAVIERQTLSPPMPAASQQGRYIPPASSTSEYEDDIRQSAPAVVERPVASVKPASATSDSSVIAQTPKREGKFIKPVAGKIISGYGPKKDGLHNDGINIQAAKGDPVRAAESGVVVYTGNQIAGYGNLVLIRHADKFVSAYAHLDKMLVTKGSVVKRGQTIGTVGSTGSVDKPQLHFEIRKGTKALDPSGLLGL